MTRPTEPSEIFSLSDRAVDTLAADDPVEATFAGIEGHDHRWPDFSPEGAAASLQHHRQLRAEALELKAAGQTNSITDELACRVLVDHCDEAVAAHEARLHLTNLNNIDSPHQHLRHVFDVQAATSADDWEAIVERLATIDIAIDGYRDSLETGRRTGYLISRRQIEAAIEQGAAAAGPSSSFEALRRRLATAEVDHGAVSERTVSERLDRAIGVQVEPAGGALAAHYVPPSEDFSRPGCVWYPIDGRERIPLFREITIAYHEGFPGHHLQVGVQSTMKDQLSRFHRLMVWYPGSGEGWALYAERLMGELGYLEKPDYEATPGAAGP